MSFLFMQTKPGKDIMKTAWLSLILLFAACGSAGSNANYPAENETLPSTDLERVHVGVKAPDFTLESTDNDTIKLSDYRGKKNVILVFYRGYW
jgi:cytochrome oxidase Cu insertion factor (SCO1/SenC/PrrC family)